MENKIISIGKFNGMNAILHPEGVNYCKDGETEIIDCGDKTIVVTVEPKKNQNNSKGVLDPVIMINEIDKIIDLWEVKSKNPKPLTGDVPSNIVYTYRNELIKDFIADLEILRSEVEFKQKQKRQW